MATTVTFTNDIAPMFARWSGQMMWRLNLASYDDVKANASIIYDQISSGNMPPPNIATLTQNQIQTFKIWMDEGCPQ